MKIPYGIADFAEICRAGYFYIDKTPFLPAIERPEIKNVVFLRPRRMGKSALLSMMAHYYDLSRADQFEALFKGLWVYEHPTPEKNEHIVLHLNLGSVRGTTEDEVKEGFAEALHRSIDILLPRIIAWGPGLREFHDRKPQLTKASYKPYLEAIHQLERYTQDPVLVPLLTKSHAMKAVAWVFVGAKEIHCRPWPRGSAEAFVVPPRKAAKKKAKA